MNILELKEKFDLVDTKLDAVLVHVRASHWTPLIVAAFGIFCFIAGWKIRGWL